MSSKSKAPHSLVAAQCKYNRRLQHTDSNGGRNEKEQLKLQFPALPKEWEGKYIPGQMYQHQHSLPGLPVPPLQQTLQKYITSVEVPHMHIHVHTHMHTSLAGQTLHMQGGRVW